MEEVSAILQKATAMRIDIITLFPELLRSPFEASIVKRAIEAAKPKCTPRPTRLQCKQYKQVDDYPYGGGAGW